MKTGILRMIPWVFPVLMASCALHFPEPKSESRRVEMASRAEPVEVTYAPDVPVLMFADELHTGLILKLDWLERYGFVKPPEIGDHEHVVFSWGDETAYVQERWLTPGQVVHALVLPSPSVMEIIPIDWNIPEVMPTQRLFQGFAAEAAGAPLADFLNCCAVMNKDGLPKTIGPSGWGRGRLIRSPHSYYFPRICNIWTVDALNAAGFRISGIRGLSADGMVRQVTNERNGFQQIWAPEWQMERAGPES